VQHAADLRRPLLLQDARRVLLGLARVDDDGAAHVTREPDLAPEDLLLHVARRVVVVVVEAHLADRRDASREVAQLRLVRAGVPRRLVRVDADRGPRRVERLGELHDGGRVAE
jgi:hypothetical protein